MKTVIDSLYREVKSGADFGTVAQKASDDKSSAVNGGILPWFGSGSMMKDSVFKSAKGFHNVRFFRNDLQGKCDSLFYSDRDSVMRMYGLPVLWSDQQQISGEEIHVLINGLVGGLGVGHSKKESHQNASKMALKKLQEDEEFNEQVFLPKPEVSTDAEEAEVINESGDQTGELVSDPVVTTVQPEEQTTN